MLAERRFFLHKQEPSADSHYNLSKVSHQVPPDELYLISSFCGFICSLPGKRPSFEKLFLWELASPSLI